MKNYKISLNQLADFSDSTESAKKRIIAQQQRPDPFRIQWYQLSKARIKKSIEHNGDLKPIHEGIKTLMERVPSNNRQASDKTVSIEAMERFVKMKLPEILQEIDYTVIKSKVKSFMYSNVNIIVAPEIIIKGELNGKTVIGGIKIHISKNKPFDLRKSQYVASTIYKFLNKEVALENETVMPELCYSLDIFSNRIVSAEQNNDYVFKEIDKIIEEIKFIWDAA
ncbi:MAG: hypothetical protein K9J13_05585 [Saprospiraceae bacterium]|nr:hypothetical protein [Saprospiraceae bacterium]